MAANVATMANDATTAAAITHATTATRTRAHVASVVKDAVARDAAGTVVVVTVAIGTVTEIGIANAIRTEDRENALPNDAMSGKLNPTALKSLTVPTPIVPPNRLVVLRSWPDLG